MKKESETEMSGTMDDPKALSEMEAGLNSLLKLKTVERVWLYNNKELAIQFEGGGRLFVNSRSRLDFSVT
jgi:hypothetical protein